MDYFAGLDISMDETHVCVVDREGVVVHESKTASTAEAIAVELAKAPSCRRIVFETGRMAGLSGLGPPAVSVGRGRLRRQHIEMRRPAGANPPVRGRQRHADALQRVSSNSRTGPSRSPSDQRCARRGSLWLAASRSSCMRCCETGPSSRRPSRPRNPRDRRPNRAPKRSDARGREQTTARILLQGPTTRSRPTTRPTAIST